MTHRKDLFHGDLVIWDVVTLGSGVWDRGITATSVVAAVTRAELLFVCQETDLQSGIQTVYRLQHPNQKPLGHVL